MGERVIFLFMGSVLDSWNDMTEQEQKDMMAKVGESRDAVGGKSVVMASCEWSTPEFAFFGVEEYPSIEALRKHIARQREIGFTAHLEESYIVGTPWEESD